MDPQQDVIELPDKHPLRIRAEQAEAEVVTLRKQVAAFESVCVVCPSCGGMGYTTHDILRFGNEHDTEERPCTACAELGWVPKGVVTLRETLAGRVIEAIEAKHEIVVLREQLAKMQTLDEGRQAEIDRLDNKIELLRGYAARYSALVARLRELRRDWNTDKVSLREFMREFDAALLAASHEVKEKAK